MADETHVWPCPHFYVGMADYDPERRCTCRPVADETCTCAHDGNARRCPIHTQADYDASARADETVRLTEQEPFLIASMRRKPTGDIRHNPEGGGALGTSARGFLAEFDGYVAARLSAVEAERDEARAARRAERDHYKMVLSAVEAERDRLRETVARVEAVAWSPSLPSCGVASRDYDGCFVHEALLRLRAALDDPS